MNKKQLLKTVSKSFYRELKEDIESEKEIAKRSKLICNGLDRYCFDECKFIIVGISKERHTHCPTKNTGHLNSNIKYIPEYSSNYFDYLTHVLMWETFCMSKEEAKPIIDKFINKHPEILERYKKEFLYKI